MISKYKHTFIIFSSYTNAGIPCIKPHDLEHKKELLKRRKYFLERYFINRESEHELWNWAIIGLMYLPTEQEFTEILLTELGHENADTQFCLNYEK